MEIIDNTLQHPWLQSLLSDGPAAIEGVLHGTAALGNLSAAEPEDAIDALLSQASHGSSLWQTFDDACLELLRKFKKTIFTLQEPQYTVTLLRAYSLLSIVRRLLPEKTVTNFHDDKVRWSELFENFVLDNGFDMRREFYRILALSQDIAAQHTFLTRPPRYLMPFWLSLCSESGGTGIYDKTYLRIGLMGLRSLPLGEEFSSNDYFALQGLGRWAAFRQPKKENFLQQWHVLKGDFPRDDTFWRSRIEKIVADINEELSLQTDGARQNFSAANWWLKRLAQGEHNTTPAYKRVLDPPAPEAREKLLRNIQQPFAQLKTNVENIIQAHRDYADRSGDIFYLVRTACKIGSRLILSGSISERNERGEFAIKLARMALQYEFDNFYAWALLRDALKTAGRLEDAELVGWEAVRLFPEDQQFRNQLALLLSDSLDRPEEAEVLLRQTIELFPQDAVAPTQLALLLSDSLGRPEEAEVLLRQTIELFPQNPHTISQLARLIGKVEGRIQETIELLETATYEYPANTVFSKMLNQLRSGKPFSQKRPTKKTSPKKLYAANANTLNMPNAQARRLLFRYETRFATSCDEIQDFLDTHERSAYLNYLAERTQTDAVSNETTFSLALAKALSSSQPLLTIADLKPTLSLEASLVAVAKGINSGQVVSFAETLKGFMAVMPRFSTLNKILSRDECENEEQWRKRSNILLRDVSVSFLSRNYDYLLDEAA